MKRNEGPLKLEEIRQFRQNQKIGRVAKKIIFAVSAAGFMAAALVAPKILRLLDDRSTRQKEWYIKEVLDRLISKKLLEKVSKGNRFGYKLTPKGEELAMAYELQALSIHKPWRWDGRWRVVIADIPEHKRGARDELRSILAGLGFVLLQKSVWIHPYPCADIVSLLKRRYDLGKQVLYMEVDVLENDHWLRDIFSLR